MLSDVKGCPSGIIAQPFAWPSLMTKMLVYMWRPQGMTAVMDMVEAFYNNLGMMTTAALASGSKSSSPSIKALERRYKRVFSLSKSPALQTADLLCEYKNMADDFVRLELQKENPSTELGRKWNARGSDLEDTPQARSNLITHGIQCPWSQSSGKRRWES